jgi:hypothetical protein
LDGKSFKLICLGSKAENSGLKMMLSGRTKVDAITGDWLSEVSETTRPSECLLIRTLSSILLLEVYKKKRRLDWDTSQASSTQ